MNWKHLTETVGVASAGGAVGAIADALSAGHYELEHLLRSALTGACIAVAALYRTPPNRDSK